MSIWLHLILYLTIKFNLNHIDLLSAFIQHTHIPEIPAVIGGGSYKQVIHNSPTLFKADYGHETGRRPYPTYGDYYRTHRYPLNDGWMLWDEDLRDLDSKSNKIGLGKDGGR